MMSGKLAFSIFIARLLLTGIKHQDKSNISPKQPWFTCNKKERMDIVFQTTEKEKVWLIVFFNREEWGWKRNAFLAVKCFCVTPSAHTAVRFTVACAMKRFWRKELLFRNSIMSKKNETNILQSQLCSNHICWDICERILESQVCELLNVCIFKNFCLSYPWMNFQIF